LKPIGHGNIHFVYSLKLKYTPSEKKGKLMKVKTDLKAGSLMSDTTQQAQQMVSSATNYLQDARKDVLDFAQIKLDKARQAWQAIASI
jgi:hypothetical protein